MARNPNAPRTRRMLLKAVGVGGGVAMLGACSSSSALGVETPMGSPAHDAGAMGTRAGDAGHEMGVIAPIGSPAYDAGHDSGIPLGMGVPAHDAGIIMSSGTLVADAGLMKGLDVHDAGFVGDSVDGGGAGGHDAQILGSFADAAIGSPAHDAGFVGDSVDGGGPGGHDATVGGP